MDFAAQDVVLILFLAFLECVLSVDNALVLAMLARALPKNQQKKALTYGLIGAVVFRLIALAIVTQLIQWNWVKFVGGGYLLYIAIKHLFFGEEDHHDARKLSGKSFWAVVLSIELTDLAFAVDSILAAVAITTKLYIVFLGGILGVIAMRYAATGFLVLLRKFPAFEKSAFLMILVIGTKLVVEGFRLPGINFHSAASPSFWVFWGLMAISLLYGFSKRGVTTPEEAEKLREEKKSLQGLDKVSNDTFPGDLPKR